MRGVCLILSLLLINPTFGSRDDISYGEALQMGGEKILFSGNLRFPLVRIRTLRQAEACEGKVKSALQIIKETFQQKGLKGFYRGAPLYLGEMTIRELYKFPLMTSSLPHKIGLQLPLSWQGPMTDKMICGSILAILDSSLCPITNLRNLKITANGPQSLHTLFSKVEGNLRQKMFRGYSAKLTRQSLYYPTLFLLDDFIRSRALLLNQGKQLSFLQSMATSCCVGIGTTLSLTPVEVILVLVQKENAIVDRGLWKNAISIYKAGGIRASFTGLTVHMVQRTIGSIATVAIYEAHQSKVTIID